MYCVTYYTYLLETCRVRQCVLYCTLAHVWASKVHINALGSLHNIRYQTLCLVVYTKIYMIVYMIVYIHDYVHDRIHTYMNMYIIVYMDIHGTMIAIARPMPTGHFRPTFSKTPTILCECDMQPPNFRVISITYTVFRSYLAFNRFFCPYQPNFVNFIYMGCT